MKLIRSLVLSAFAAATLFATAPASASNLPDFCTNPTTAERQKFCRELKAMDEALKALESLNKTMGEITDSIKKTTKELERRSAPNLRTMPKRQDIPSDPRQVR